MWQKVKNIYHLLRAFTACIYFGFPSKKLTVIGVTGTDGKTTTSHMIYEILKSANKKVSLISSIHAQIGEKTYDTGFHVTTPDPVALQKFLRKVVNSDSECLVLEVTSHGLDQNRIFGVDFDFAVLTNITHEHLDYHKSFENYILAKARLFKGVKVSILNLDDPTFSKIKKLANGKIITYSIGKKADFAPKNFPLKLKIPGEYNLSNALCAAALATQVGISKKIITKALNNFQGVKGRMEEVDMGQDYQVKVDFAHTPNGLKQALKTLKSRIKGQGSRVIAVFGAAGERDKLKRPKMGKIAAIYADICVLTAEDPRSEKVEDICWQIARGLVRSGKKEGSDFYQIYDRQKAIEFAVKLAKPGDIVVCFGKSHEKSMCFGKKEYPWDEFKSVERAITKTANEKE
ncbi:hypothetical protein A3D07_00140 [Candidatus Curtissbacteria bacterium RIFCSPHIGHO2_02_FULL_42_15]|uniref:UDP-N-acetylmuramyl-tripeptide synthetase n=1 Tax=Candidatus Curtissbacteria bacterium RIFCSPHIGHO2_02_FULL_42_15 TaxID=1797716 RepID=A0A1F5GDM7_9BACT|nr:MAG: hypothetical protein A3D07_00140 [Candidatus Curtissbacteria bacterium RIFCSPHIGHO2_02_FULL_42_15]